MAKPSHGRTVKFAYFHCEACDDFTSFSPFVDEGATWRCDCGDLATFLGWGTPGKLAYDRKKRIRETRLQEAAQRRKWNSQENEKRKADGERILATNGAGIVLDGFRNAIRVRRQSLELQASKDRFDRLVCDGIRKMIGEEY